MELGRYLRAGNWPVAIGYVLFIGMMAIGYFYNVTFVQLGLKDLGERALGLPPAVVAGQMAVLAILTGGVALAFGFWQQRHGPASLLRKLQLALAITIGQTILTAVAPHINSQTTFWLWILFCSPTLGIGVPVTFSLTTDLIPVRDRGYVAAIITAIAYFMAAVFAESWRIEALSRLLLVMMFPGVLILAGIVLPATAGTSLRGGAWVARLVAELAQNHQLARFGHGRFLRMDELTSHRLNRRFLVFVALMFGIFFVDSLGFLRIIDTPILVDATWQASRLAPRLTIGVAHILSALIAGILYTHLGQRHLFYWIFGLFALIHFSYAVTAWLLPETTSQALGTPVLYATAVSLYTVLNFALWADFSTPQTISRNAAIGVAFSGWTATFISTALAIHWQSDGMSVVAHLRLVQAIAMVFLLIMLVLVLWPGRRTTAHSDTRPRKGAQDIG